MSIFQATVLGIVQGLTEFLPVSSSGHLVLANYYFGWGERLPFYVDLATNAGTFLAVILALYKDVWAALSGFFRGLVSREARREDGWRMALLVIAGSVPTAVIGLGLKPYFEALNQPLYVSFALIVTGAILWFTPRSGPKDEVAELTFVDAVVGGLAQGLAVVPGISRSGTTISTMMWRGATAATAARFSFLMYLVASLGATLIGVGEVREAAVETGPLVAMIAASFVTGYAAILGLFAILRRGQFKLFAPYLWAVAALTLLTLWLR